MLSGLVGMLLMLYEIFPKEELIYRDSQCCEM